MLATYLMKVMSCVLSPPIELLRGVPCDIVDLELAPAKFFAEFSEKMLVVCVLLLRPWCVELKILADELMLDGSALMPAYCWLSNDEFVDQSIPVPCCCPARLDDTRAPVPE